LKNHKHLKQETWILFGNVWNVEIPFKPHPHQKYAQAATKSAPLKMSPVTPQIAAAQEILIRSFDWTGA